MKLFLALIVLVGFIGTAVAQNPANCAPYNTAVHALKSKFNESMTGVGVLETGIAVELFTSPHGETWTLIFHLPGEDGGGACVVGAGEDWQNIEPKEPELPKT